MPSNAFNEHLARSRWLFEDEDELEWDIISELFFNDEEDTSNTAKGKKRMIHRNREEADHNIYVDYFAPQPRFPEDFFRRRFRLSKSLFARIEGDLQAHDKYWVQKRVRHLGIFFYHYISFICSFVF